MVLDDGLRYLCSEHCRRAFLGGARTHESPAHEPGRPSVPDRVREATRPRIDLEAARAVDRPPPSRPAFPWPAAVAAGSALVLAVLSQRSVAVAALSGALTALAAGLVARNDRQLRGELGLLPWLLGPAGTMLAAAAGLLARLHAPDAWLPLAGAAVTAGALVARSWLDARARYPVEQTVHALLRDLPDRLRVPADGPSDARYVEVPTARLRTGEEILAIEGEVVGVDGVVQGGEAKVLLHPGAQLPVRRVTGDPVLAGAKVLEGAIRLLSTRVADERALARVRRFGTSDHSGASVARLAEQTARGGGVLALAFAVGALALSGSPTLAGQLSAAAAVLIAVPLLSARRSSELPLVAAAAAASARGIVFHDARTLENAGRVVTAALCTSGTITEGQPEVVEIDLVGAGGEVDADALLALVAGAEAVCQDHPIARALRRHASGRGLTPVRVRRPVHHPGRGITAQTPQGPLIVGNRGLLLSEGVSVALADATAARAEERGYTALLVSLAGRVRAVIALRDELHVGSRAALQRLFDQHIEVVLLSGDHRSTVEVLARQLDVSHVKAELLPEERATEVRRLRDSGGLVAVIGRRGHDDAALAAADIPVVLGAAGAPEGERAIALATDDIRDAASALWIARAAREKALRGVLVSIGVGAPLLAGAALGWVPPGIAALFALAIDGFALPVGPRLLRRIELRVPAR